MQNTIHIILLIFLTCSGLIAENLDTEIRNVVRFKNWILDIDNLKIIELQDDEEVNVIWNVDEEPRLWDRNDLGIDGVRFPVYYQDSTLLGYIFAEVVLKDTNIIIGSQITFELYPNSRILWTYNPEPPLFYGHYLKFILSGYKLYIAIYDPISSGSGLVCVNVKTGEEIWRGEVVQMMIGHSEYMNEVHIKLIDDIIVIAGDEAGGYYLQLFDRQSGERLFCEFNNLWRME